MAYWAANVGQGLLSEAGLVRPAAPNVGMHEKHSSSH
jgi:hypothetical protein